MSYNPLLVFSLELQDDEMMFVKHNQLFIYNTKTGQTQSHAISETKYSLINVAADKTHIYIATTDMGFLIKVCIIHTFIPIQYNFFE